MGLSVRVGMQPKSGGFFKRSESFQDVLEKIAASVSAYAKEKGIDALSYLTLGQESMVIGLHPAEEEMHFYVESGYLVCSAKTSSVGPGYHAFVVELLETVEKKCGFNWDWNNEKMGFEDECGYYEHKNYQLLQETMCYHLQVLARFFINRQSEGKFNISLSLDLRIEHDCFAISPMGPWDKEFFQEIDRLELSEIHTKADKFFAWWNKDMDALFWKNVGMVWMWTEIKWQPPIDQQAMTYPLLLTTLECFEKARELSDGDMQFPEEEIKEIEILLSVNDYFIPKQGLVGFYRLNRRMPLTGNWSILLPGYFYEAKEEDESRASYFHKDRSIFAHSFFDPSGEIPEFPADEEIDNQSLGVFTFEKDTCVGKATLIRAPESEGGYQILICHAAAPGSVCTVTLAMDHDEDFDWAIETFKSIEPLENPTYNTREIPRLQESA